VDCRADNGAVEGGSAARLALKTLHWSPVFGKLFGQELERDGALELGVLGLIRHARAAAGLLQDAILEDSRAGHESGPTFAGIWGRRHGQVSTQPRPTRRRGPHRIHEAPPCPVATVAGGHVMRGPSRASSIHEARLTVVATSMRR
jgi:hypothetical protein